MFVYVVRSNQDHFAGVRHNLRSEGHETRDITLREAEFDIVDSVEYTRRRPFRFWFYATVFQSLHKQLDAFFEAENGPVCIYFSDEGVWAVFWEVYRKRLKRSNVIAVNVQHGFALAIPASHRWLRRVMNALAIACTGYPAIGYGSAGGAGSAPFDAYLTYDETIAHFVELQSGRPAVPAPRVIKHQLISRFQSFRREPRDRLRILFAMNVAVPGSPILCASTETYDILLDLARVIRAAGAELIFRLHPGMNHNEEVSLFAAHPIAELSSLDNSQTLDAAMAGSDIVLSYFSTALWEGRLLGLVAAQVVCRCCKPVDLGYDLEIIDLSNDISGQLRTLLTLARSRRNEDWHAAEIEEWRAVKALFHKIGCYV